MHRTCNYVTKPENIGIFSEGSCFCLMHFYLQICKNKKQVKSLRVRFDIAEAEGFLNCSQNLVCLNDKSESFTET